MPQIVWENNTNATLAAPITNSQTTIALTSGQGAQFPSPGVNQFFPVTIQSASLSTVFEICYCTSRSGDVLTVVRGQEGTPGTAFNAGDTVQNRATAGTQWPGALLYLGVTGTTTLTTVESGTFIECTGSAPSAVTIPAPTAGVTYRFWNAQTAATITLSTPSGQFFGPFGSSAATYSLLPGVYIQLESDGSGWLVTVLQPSLSPLVNVISNTTLTFSQTGSTVEINGASGYTLTFPSPVGINGCFYWVVNLTTVAQTLSTPAAVFAGPNGSAAATLTMLPQSSFRINSDGVNWVVSQLSATILPKTIFSSASPGTAVIPLGWTHYRARAWTAGGGGGIRC